MMRMLRMLSGLVARLWSRDARAVDAWRDPRTETPERGRPIEWMAPGGHVVRGSFCGVWMMDEGMYVYYTPSGWRYAAEGETC